MILKILSNLDDSMALCLRESYLCKLRCSPGKLAALCSWRSIEHLGQNRRVRLTLCSTATRIHGTCKLLHGRYQWEFLIGTRFRRKLKWMLQEKALQQLVDAEGSQWNMQVKWLQFVEMILRAGCHLNLWCSGVIPIFLYFSRSTFRHLCFVVFPIFLLHQHI